MNRLIYAIERVKKILTFPASNNITGKSVALNSKDDYMARITQLNDKYALTLNGAVVATYARARDARRGAQRRGLVVA